MRLFNYYKEAFTKFHKEKRISYVKDWELRKGNWRYKGKLGNLKFSDFAVFLYIIYETNG